MIRFDFQKCPICSYSSKNISQPESRSYLIKCERCGEFRITCEVIDDCDLDDIIAVKLSYWIKSNQNKLVDVTLTIFSQIKNIFLPTLKEQINNLILYLGNISKPGETKDLKTYLLISIIGCYDPKGVLFVLDYLKDNSFIFIEHPADTEPLSGRDIKILKCHLTFKGWDKYDEIRRVPDIGKIAFMAMKYGNNILEEIFSNKIKFAIKQTGFEIQLLRDVLKAGSIDDQLRVQLRTAKFLVVDLTDDNNGAYWEAGFAEGLNKPVIYLCEKDKFDKFKTHFDTNHLTTVLWKEETIEEDMKNLKAVIRNTFPLEAKLED